MLAISKNGFNFVLGLFGIVFLFNVAAAQTTATTIDGNLATSTTLPPPGPVSCQNASAKNINLTSFHGMWFEAARKTNSNQACNALNFLNETNPITVISTYNDNPEKLSLNVSMPAYEINLVGGIYKLNTSNGADEIFKILDTDYENYAFICSYFNITNSTASAPATTTEPSTSITPETTLTTETATNPAPASSTAAPSLPQNVTLAYIFVRNRPLNDTYLKNLTAVAETKYSDFKNLKIVNQSEKCSGGSANLVPMLTMIIAVVLATVFKF